MPIRRTLLACLLALCPLALPLAGCGDRSIVAPDLDAGADAGADAGQDAGADAGSDAGRDAGADAGSDAGSDAGLDAGLDAGPDGGSDGGTDGGADGGCPHACGQQCVPESATSCGPNCDVCPSTNGNTPACMNHACTQSCDTSTHHICALSGNCAPDDSVSQCGTFCSGCLPVLNGTRSCTNNGLSCAYTCDPGYHDCGGTFFPCSDNTSPSSCGTRCTSCAAPPTTNAHSTCTNAACGWECNAGYHLCGGACVAVSPSSCGATCKVCATPSDPNAVATCDASGSCGNACKAGFHSCGGVCVTEDKTSCGASCEVCPAPPANSTEQCLGHACTYVCAAPLLKCHDGCCPAASVWAGGLQTCVVLSTGELRCFGNLGSSDSTSVPRAESPAGGLYAAASMAGSTSAGLLYRCGLSGTGRVVCFDGSPTGQQLGTSATQLTAGDGHVCWVTTSGSIKCVGANGSGQLGNSTTTASATPVDVVGFASGGAIAVAAHGNTTCALTTGGAVQCWGQNASGQLGDGTQTSRSAPVNVSGLTSGVAAIAVGDDHACALVGAGSAATLKCWGDNTYGQLGNGGSTTSSLVPVTVTGLGAAPIAVSAGASTTCALLSGGTVKCWGYNGYGQVGNGDSGSYKVLTPSTVANVSGATSLSSGYWHSCAKTSAGVFCWGWNSYGQCGNGVTLGQGGSIDEYSAVQVVGQ